MKDATQSPAVRAPLPNRMPWLYGLTIALLALTGFGQMPIYNRYYLSDLPGFGWLADFYATRHLHYIGAAVLLGILAFAAFDYLFLQKKEAKLTGTGCLRLGLLAGVVISGALIVVKNFPHVHFSHGTIIGLNLFHICTVMAFLLTNLMCRLTRKRWTAAR
jgi:hypothetical protein